MLFTQLFTALYGKKTYKHSVNLLRIQVKTDIVKDQFIFMEKFLKNNTLKNSLKNFLLIRYFFKNIIRIYSKFVILKLSVNRYDPAWSNSGPTWATMTQNIHKTSHCNKNLVNNFVLTKNNVLWIFSTKFSSKNNFFGKSWSQCTLFKMKLWN